MAVISELLFEAAASFRSLTAIKIGDRKISYQEFNDKALAVAALLVKAGADKTAVGLVGQRKASSYIGILATLYAGCYYTPINPKYSPARLKAILGDAGIRFLIGDVEDMLKLEETLGQDALPGFVLVPENTAPAGRNWLDQSALQEVQPLTAPENATQEQLAYLLYTSGSTGVPKGVQVTHANISAFVKNMSIIYPLEPGFRASQTFDFSFDPSVSDMFFTWYRGGQLCVLPEEEMMLPGDYLIREKITYWNAVPSLAAFMYKLGQLTANRFPDLQYSMFCGEQFPRHIADAWKLAAPNSTVENLYGPTEATIYISRYHYADTDAGKTFRNSIIPIGSPLPGHEVALVDDQGNRVATGETGEICFKGPQITKGYLNDDAKTAAVFVDFAWDTSGGGKWYKTGDLGFVNEDGNMECIGRRDSQIKLGGRRIEIGEIEATLAKFQPLNDVVVVPLRDDNEIVTGCVAFTTTALGREEENQIRNDSTAFMERVFFPKKIITVERLPLSPSGKTDRKALAALAKEMLLPASKKA